MFKCIFSNDKSHLEAYAWALSEHRAQHKHGAALSDPAEVLCELSGADNAGVLILYDNDRNVVGGAAIANGVIMGLFAQSGYGSEVVKCATACGGRELDCFDGFLPGYYSRFGFVEYDRQANWVAGEPDVVYMRLHASAVQHALSAIAGAFSYS